jgi:hypothetical protein
MKQEELQSDKAIEKSDEKVIKVFVKGLDMLGEGVNIIIFVY